MSCFRLPTWLLERIDVIRRNFLWSKAQPAMGIHLLNWRTVCLPKTCGGFGVSDLHLQNIALLLRWWWAIFAPTHKLWKFYATMLYALPAPQPAPLILLKRGSFFWNSISSLRPLFHSCSQFDIVSGETVSFWYDGWDGLPLMQEKTGPIPLRTISLAQVRHCSPNILDTPLTLRQHLACQKLNTLILTPGCDRLLWTISSSRKFSVKSIYKILSEGGKIKSQLLPLWRAKATLSMKIFFILLLKNRILTHDNMQRRHLPHTAGCVMCPELQPNPQEMGLHLFFLCPFATRVWISLSRVMGYPLVQVKESVQLTFLASAPADKTRRKKWETLFITTTWLLWKERNKRNFRHNTAPVSVITARILHETDLCLRYC